MVLYPIFSYRITRKLKRRGFTVIKVAPNHKFPERIVYYFEDTPALRRVMDGLIK